MERGKKEDAINFAYLQVGGNGDADTSISYDRVDNLGGADPHTPAPIPFPRDKIVVAIDYFRVQLAPRFRIRLRTDVFVYVLQLDSHHRDGGPDRHCSHPIIN